jgi:hypothetical protein
VRRNCPFADLIGGLIKRPTGGLDRRQPPDPVGSALVGQVQHAVSRVQVLLAAGPVRQPLHGHLPKHALQRAMMTSFDRPTLHTPLVSDLLDTLLAASAEIEMILKQCAQQIATFRLDPRLQSCVLKPASLLD